MQVKGTRLWCVLKEYVKDNYYTRFYDPSYHRYRERHFSVSLVKKSDSQWSVKCRSRIHWVMLCACRVCQGQLLCMVS